MRVTRVVAAVACLIATFVPPALAQGSIETCRIRLENRTGGEISVSGDNGHSYIVIGHVLTPATWLIPGFSATEWAREGTVCATAVHGIRICTGHNAADRGKLFSIVPREYQTLPDSFGGQRTGGAGIYTDIPAGASIFRNLAPMVGNPVFVEKDGILQNIAKDYCPQIGDVLVIVVQMPVHMPTEIDFSNQKDGLVEEIFPSGEKVVVARVVQPVSGIGRYDATSYTGVGRINTNHPGVITVSTAEESGVDISDEERGWERRGGFQIVPVIHAGKDWKTFPPSAMILGPPAGSDHGLEGTPPLFSGLIGLQSVPGREDESFRVDVKIDHGDWEPMPELIGVDSHLFEAAHLNKFFANRGMRRMVKQGITDLRILFPHPDKDYVDTQVRLAVRAVSRSNIDLAGTDDNDALVRGEVQVNVNFPGDPEGLKYIAFLVDGQTRGVTNSLVRPYTFVWDTTIEKNGHHVLTIRGQDDQGKTLTEATNNVIVANEG